MPHEYVYWLTEKHFDELIVFLWAFLFLDMTRYALLKIIVAVIDAVRTMFFKREGRTYCPSVTVLLAGHNESSGIENTLHSVWGSYPKLEIIVIDDGSTDGMTEKVQNFAKDHSGVILLRRERRGGKASAINYGFAFASGEIIVVLDSDSTLEKGAIWHLVQPFKDSQVGAVAGNLLPRNIFSNLLTWFQAYEYLHSIFVGRLVSARLNILGIVSGAFGGFRREVWQRCAGMDVGPPEDLDFTIKIRKIGYKIGFAEAATCYTDVPETLSAFTKQRFRWEEGGVVRNHCRKHIGLINIFSPNFRWSNLVFWAETIYFELVSPYIILAYYVWLVAYVPAQDLIYVLVWLYGVYLMLELAQIVICMFYSTNILRDLKICIVLPLLIFYRTYLLFVRVMANTQELLWRVSYDDNYVPKHVREVTWHW